jgi:hypothetical protein
VRSAECKFSQFIVRLRMSALHEQTRSRYISSTARNAAISRYSETFLPHKISSSASLVTCERTAGLVVCSYTACGNPSCSSASITRAWWPFWCYSPPFTGHSTPRHHSICQCTTRAYAGPSDMTEQTESLVQKAAQAKHVQDARKKFSQVLDDEVLGTCRCMLSCRAHTADVCCSEQTTSITTQ